MKRIPVAMFVVSLILSSGVWTPSLAMAQVPIQRGNSVSVRVGSTPIGTGVSLGLTYRLNPVLDAAFAFHSIPTFAYNPVSPFTSEFDLGLRAHLPVTTPVFEPYVGGGVSVTRLTGGGSATGLFLQAGTSISLAPLFKGYVGLTYGSAAGVSTTSYDVGVQFLSTPLVSASVGVAGSSGGGNLYLGITAGF